MNKISFHSRDNKENKMNKLRKYKSKLVLMLILVVFGINLSAKTDFQDEKV